MISFIQNILQKHHKWLLGILLFVIIIAFVFTIGAPGISSAKQQSLEFYGTNLLNQVEMSRIARSVALSAKFEGLDDTKELGKNMNQLVLQRIVLLGLADELKVPQPNSSNLKSYLQGLPLFLDENGRFSIDRYRSVIEMFNRNGASKEELTQMLCDNYRIALVLKMVNGSQHVFEHQVMTRLIKDYTQYDFVVAKLKCPEYNKDEFVGDEDLRRYYDLHMQDYVQQPLHSLSMVRFKSKWYKKDVPVPSDEVLFDFFAENKSLLWPKSEFVDVKDEILESYIAAQANRILYDTAGQFVEDMYRDNIIIGSAEFVELLNKYHLKLETFEPFTKEEMPVVDGVHEMYVMRACDLDSQRPYTDPCPANFGCVVLFKNWTKPAYQMSFDEAREKVRQHYLEDKALSGFMDHIEAVRGKIADALPSVGDVYQVLNDDGLTKEVFKGVSLKNAKDQEIDDLYLSAIASLKKGEKVKLTSVDRGEVLFLIVLNSVAPDPLSFQKEEVEMYREFFRKLNQEVTAMVFFEEQLRPLSKQK